MNWAMATVTGWVTAVENCCARRYPFQALMKQQVARARTFYSSAMAALPAVDRRAQRPGLIMAAIYRTLLEEIGGIARPEFPCAITYRRH